MLLKVLERVLDEFVEWLHGLLQWRSSTRQPPPKPDDLGDSDMCGLLGAGSISRGGRRVKEEDCPSSKKASH